MIPEGFTLTSSLTDPFTIPLDLPTVVEEPDFHYYIYDHLGNTRMVYSTVLVGCDSEGGVVPEYTLEAVLDYFPYGKILREFIKTPEKYVSTGYERDTETGLDYRGARFYDSGVARFLSLDPHASDYPELSDYCYVAANPITYIDPDGKDVIDSKMKRKNGKYHNSYIRFINTKKGRNLVKRFSSKKNESSLSFLKKSKDGDMSKHTLLIRTLDNESMHDAGGTRVYLKGKDGLVGISNISAEDIKNNDLEFLFAIDIRESVSKKAADGSVVIGHEAFLHAEKYIEAINALIKEVGNGNLTDNEIADRLKAIRKSSGYRGENHHNDYLKGNDKSLPEYFDELIEDVADDSKKVGELTNVIKEHDGTLKE
jgi:RHS repeat-associated protein